MCNFTKGPWIARGATPSRVYGMARTDKEVLVAACGSVVEQAGANAHLIAVAPEMYEFIETYMGGHPEAEQLLAKARGEHA